MEKKTTKERARKEINQLGRRNEGDEDENKKTFK